MPSRAVSVIALLFSLHTLSMATVRADHREAAVVSKSSAQAGARLISGYEDSATRSPRRIVPPAITLA